LLTNRSSSNRRASPRFHRGRILFHISAAHHQRHGALVPPRLGRSRTPGEIAVPLPTRSRRNPSAKLASSPRNVFPPVPAPEIGFVPPPRDGPAEPCTAPPPTI
jgi:hypothetical protein